MSSAWCMSTSRPWRDLDDQHPLQLYGSELRPATPTMSPSCAMPWWLRRAAGCAGCSRWAMPTTASASRWCPARFRPRDPACGAAGAGQAPRLRRTHRRVVASLQPWPDQRRDGGHQGLCADLTPQEIAQRQGVAWPPSATQIGAHPHQDLGPAASRRWCARYYAAAAGEHAAGAWQPRSARSAAATRAHAKTVRPFDCREGGLLPLPTAHRLSARGGLRPGPPLVAGRCGTACPWPRALQAGEPLRLASPDGWPRTMRPAIADARREHDPPDPANATRGHPSGPRPLVGLSGGASAGPFSGPDGILSVTAVQGPSGLVRHAVRPGLRAARSDTAGHAADPEGDPRHVVHHPGRAAARLQSADDNDREITGVYGPGEYIGEMSLDVWPALGQRDHAGGSAVRGGHPAHARGLRRRASGLRLELLAKAIRVGAAGITPLSTRQLALNDVYGRLKLLLDSLARAARRHAADRRAAHAGDRQPHRLLARDGQPADEGSRAGRPHGAAAGRLKLLEDAAPALVGGAPARQAPGVRPRPTVARVGSAMHSPSRRRGPRGRRQKKPAGRNRWPQHRSCASPSSGRMRRHGGGMGAGQAQPRGLARRCWYDITVYEKDVRLGGGRLVPRRGRPHPRAWAAHLAGFYENALSRDARGLGESARAGVRARRGRSGHAPPLGSFDEAFTPNRMWAWPRGQPTTPGRAGRAGCHR